MPSALTHLCAWPCAEHVSSVSPFTPHLSPWKWRERHVHVYGTDEKTEDYLAQCHSANAWQGQDSNPGCLPLPSGWVGIQYLGLIWGYWCLGVGLHYGGEQPSGAGCPPGDLESWETEAGTQGRLTNHTLRAPSPTSYRPGTREGPGGRGRGLVTCSSGLYVFPTSSCNSWLTRPAAVLKHKHSASSTPLQFFLGVFFGGTLGPWEERPEATAGTWEGHLRRADLSFDPADCYFHFTNCRKSVPEWAASGVSGSLLLSLSEDIPQTLPRAWIRPASAARVSSVSWLPLEHVQSLPTPFWGPQSTSSRFLCQVLLYPRHYRPTQGLGLCALERPSGPPSPPGWRESAPNAALPCTWPEPSAPRLGPHARCLACAFWLRMHSPTSQLGSPLTIRTHSSCITTWSTVVAEFNHYLQLFFDFWWV